MTPTPPPLDDSRLDQLARSLRVDADTQGVWDKLQVALEGSPGPSESQREGRPSDWRPDWRIGALLAACLLALASWSSLQIEPPVASEVLASGGQAQAFEGELARLDAAIRRHHRDILEGGSSERPGRAGLDGQLAYLDTNIEHCRELLLVNAWNRDVQRSLLRSVRRKEELLRSLKRPQLERHETL